MNTISARKLFHVFFFDNTRDIGKGITTPGQTSAASGPVLARLTGPTGTERSGAAQPVQGDAPEENSTEAAKLTGLVRPAQNFHSRSQHGGQAEMRALLQAGPGKSAPRRQPTVAEPRFSVSDRIILLSDRRRPGQTCSPRRP